VRERERGGELGREKMWFRLTDREGGGMTSDLRPAVLEVLFLVL
jgi:hypothetical protein